MVCGCRRVYSDHDAPFFDHSRTRVARHVDLFVPIPFTDHQLWLFWSSE